MRDEPPGTAYLSSPSVGGSLLAASLLEGPHQAIDGQVEVALQRRSGDSAHSPADPIAGQVALSVLAPTVLREVRGIHVDLDAPTDPID